MVHIDEFARRLVESKLAPRTQIDSQLAQWRSQFGEGTAPQFARWLVEQGLITEFQGEAILAGHTGPFMLGPYEVYEHLTVGLGGGVFRGLHKEFQQPVSLKIFPSKLSQDPEKLARLGREARAFAVLDHPNVVRSYEVDRVGDIYYLATEDLRGESLAARLARDRRLPYQTACQICKDVASGLAHLHTHEVMHLDLRPGTIWLHECGSAKVMEFGAARDALAYVDADEPDVDKLVAETQAGGFPDVSADQAYIERGDYRYISPEQAYDIGDATYLSDIYALGCVLYHCLTGRPPFDGTNPVPIALRHARDMPAPPTALVSDLPRQLDETLLAMLVKQPSERIQSANAVAFSLAEFAEKTPVGVVPSVSSAYLEWAGRSQATGETPAVLDVTPELAGFVGWLLERRARGRPR